MKNRKVVLFAILVLVVVAGLVVRVVMTPHYTLVGKWKLKIMDQSGTKEVTDHDMIKEFHADGTETSTFGDVVQQGTYTVKGDVLVESLKSAPNVRAGKADGPHTYTYKIEGSILTLNIASGIAHTSISLDRMN